jgi:hypothetical protein
MANRITEKDLQALVNRINELTDQPNKPYGDNGANVGNYHLDFAYGGVRLAQITNKGGGITCPLGLSFLTKRELNYKLTAFISGLPTKRR